MIEPVLARRIKLVGFDVDGVFTDGGLYLGASRGEPIELKRFQSQDGLAVHLLRQAGLRIVLVSGRTSEATTIRARDLHIEDVIQDATGMGNKLVPFQALIARHGVKLEECAFVGDDLPDLPVMRQVGLPIAVANAVPEVREAAAHTTRARGGHGAVREAVEALLTARGVWTKTVQAYLKELGDVPRR